MIALEKYIDDLVNNKEPKDDFPKNESSWEELYDVCGKLITELVTLKRAAAQLQSVKRTGPTPAHMSICPACLGPDGHHSVNCSLRRLSQERR